MLKLVSTAFRPSALIVLMIALASISDHASADEVPGYRECHSYPFGATQQQLDAYHATVFPHIQVAKTKVQDHYLGDLWVQNICFMKYGDMSRRPLHKHGITDKEIERVDPATLTTRLIVASHYEYNIADDINEEIDKQIKRDSVRDGSLYAPIICSMGYCNGPADPAYVFNSLLDCKRYLGQVRAPYVVDNSSSNTAMHGFCVKHAPSWQAVP